MRPCSAWLTQWCIPEHLSSGILVQCSSSNILTRSALWTLCEASQKSLLFPVLSACPSHLCNPKAKLDWSSRGQLYQQCPQPCFYGAIDGRNSCRIIAPHPQVPSALRQPYLGASHGDRGRACVCKPIFPCLIYILHSCKIMLRVFW